MYHVKLRRADIRLIQSASEPNGKLASPTAHIQADRGFPVSARHSQVERLILQTFPQSSPQSVTIDATACGGIDLSLQRREAFEEVGLPMGYHRDLHFVTQLEPFLSKYKIIVFRK